MTFKFDILKWNGSPAAATELEKKSVMEERKYSNEAIALQKVMFRAEHGMLENKIAQDETQLKIPDNNPFKKRKLDEIYLDQITNNREQMSEVIYIDTSDVMCVTLESQESVNSRPDEVADRGVSTQNGKRKIIDCKSSSKSKNNSILNFFSRI